MGVSTAAHLPSISSTSYPALTSHLLSAYNAQRVGAWNVSIRVLRSVREGHSGDGGGGKDGVPTMMRTTKLMYVVQMSEFPEDTFVLVEDAQRETRASIRNRHTFAVMAAAAAAADVAAQEKVAENVSMHLADGQDGTEEAKIDAYNGEVESIPVAAPAQPQPTPINLPSTDVLSVAGKQPTRHTLFVASTHYMMLLMRLNLPAPLGAPSMGDGQTTSSTAASAVPGAWLPRGAPIVIQGVTYDLPSAVAAGAGTEWRVRLGMIQAGGGSRGAGAMVENEYLPLLRLASDAFLTAHLHNLFPAYLTSPAMAAAGQAASITAAAAAAANGATAGAGVANPVPTPEQWQEVIPASNEAWMKGVGITGAAPNTTGVARQATSNGAQSDHEARLAGLQHELPLQQKDGIGWHGKERGRRLAYLYVTLLRNQSVI